MRGDDVCPIMKEPHRAAGRRAGFEVIARVVDSVEFAAARRVSPVTEHVVTEVGLHPAAEARIAPLIVGNEIVVEAQPALSKSEPKAWSAKLSPSLKMPPWTVMRSDMLFTVKSFVVDQLNEGWSAMQFVLKAVGWPGLGTASAWHTPKTRGRVLVQAQPLAQAFAACVSCDYKLRLV